MGASRIHEAIARAHGEGRAALVGYLCAGDPNPKDSFLLLDALAAEADVLEVGVPFSDPMADGPVIQRASERALAAGTRLADVFALIARLRKRHPELGIVLMGYLNPAFARGYARYMEEAAAAGADAVLLVDAPPEEAGEPRRAALQAGLGWVPLVAPTSDDARMRQAAAIASGFVYYVSLKGITGASLEDLEEVRARVRALAAMTDEPVCVGFGVKSPEEAAALAGVADGVVVGSRFVQEVEKGPVEKAAARIREAAATLRAALVREGRA